MQYQNINTKWAWISNTNNEGYIVQIGKNVKYLLKHETLKQTYWDVHFRTKLRLSKNAK